MGNHGNAAPAAGLKTVAPIKEANGAVKARKTSKFNNGKRKKKKKEQQTRCVGLRGLNNSLLP